MPTKNIRGMLVTTAPARPGRSRSPAGPRAARHAGALMTAVLLARPRRLPWAVLAILVAALLLVVLTPSRGSAHAYLQHSNPAYGANLAQGPVFGVRTSARPASFHETPPAPGEAAATSLLLLGLALGLGGPLARRVLVRVPGPTARPSGCSCSASRAAASSWPSSPRWLRSRWTWPGRPMSGGRRPGPTTCGGRCARPDSCSSSACCPAGVAPPAGPRRGWRSWQGRAWPLSAPRRSVMRRRGTSRSGWPSRPCILSPR